MKKYRNSHVAHYIEETVKEDFREANNISYPHLDLALNSSIYHYSYVIGKLRALGETKYPNDLQVYYDDFKKQAQEIAQAATSATSVLNERVY